MDGLALIAANGFALGLASTLHCTGMCGAISCGLLLAQERGGVRNPYVAFALTHAGRIASYAIAGSIIGAVGAPAIGWLDREAAFRLLQWAAAAALIWIGLSTAGLVPSITLLDRGLAGIADRVARANASAQRCAFIPMLSGLAWGMMPCAMVYAALFTAMLTGSSAGGMTMMGAFGLGTLPGLVAAGFGFRRLASITRGGPGKIAAGLAIAIFGAGTVAISHPVAAYLCLPRQASSSVSAGALPHASHWHPRLQLDQHQMVRAPAALASTKAVDGSAK
jgi:sulfite exporter TauE/SafE